MADNRPLPSMQRLLPEIVPSLFEVVRLDPLSPLYQAGNWLDPKIQHTLLHDAAKRTGCAITRYGEHRLSRTRHHSATAPETYALFIEARIPEGVMLFAPFAGVASGEGDRLRIDSNGCRC